MNRTARLWQAKQRANRIRDIPIPDQHRATASHPVYGEEGDRYYYYHIMGQEHYDMRYPR